MLIHFAVCGIGLGHVTRSVEIANELRVRGHEIFFTAYDQAYSYLMRNGHRPTRVMSVGYGVGDDGAISVKRTLLANMILPIRFAGQTLSEISLITQNGADLVVSDTRASATLAASVLKKPVATILNQYNVRIETTKHRAVAAFFERTIQAPQLIWNLSDIILVPDLPPPFTISESTLHIPDRHLEKTVYTGPLFKMVNHSKAELRQVREMFGATDKPLVLLVISGGLREKKSFVDIMVSMAELLSDENVYVVSTADPSSTWETRKGPVFLTSWINDLELYLQAVDVVVCRAGLSLISKCIMYGKPMVLVPTPQHGEQLSNARKAESLGICRVIEQPRLTARVLEEAVASLVENSQVSYNLKQLQRLAERCGGVKAAASAIEKLC